MIELQLSNDGIGHGVHVLTDNTTWPMPSVELLDRRQVLIFLGGVSRQTLWRYERSNGFPKPILGGRFYVKHEIDRWLLRQR